MQAGDVHTTYADVGDLNQATGFAPSTSLDAGLAKFVAWYWRQYRDHQKSPSLPSRMPKCNVLGN
jgi:UDP-glucuronate 4-epimerase